MIYLRRNSYLYYTMAQQSLEGQGLIIKISRHTVGLLWTIDQFEAWTSI
jgi:hypothetical protein